MNNSKLPTEVELIYEVMPCSAMRASQEPLGAKHVCTYFRKWGSYHSYDYSEKGPPAQPGISHPSQYVGVAPLSPEVLSGCRKSPIFVVGINPNLTGFSKTRKNSVYPLFDEFKQFAHYFRYRSTDKLEINHDLFDELGGDNAEIPPNLATNLNVPIVDGKPTIQLQKQTVKYYEELQSLLDELGEMMQWDGHDLKVGEDISYGNMVACPSARWLTATAAGYPANLVMTGTEVRGIVQECFHDRKYFLRQLFQSLPKVIMVVGSTTARPFITAMQDRFIEGDPKVNESVTELVKRKHILKYGDLEDGTELTARVIFSGHITGDPETYKAVRGKIMEQLVDEAQKGNIVYNHNSKHLLRPKGACVLCPMLEIGKCDYEQEIVPITNHPSLTSSSPAILLHEEKMAQFALMNDPKYNIGSDLLWTEDPDDFKNDSHDQ